MIDVPFGRLILLVVFGLPFSILQAQNEKVSVKWKVPAGKALGFRANIQTNTDGTVSGLGIDMDQMMDEAKSLSKEFDKGGQTASEFLRRLGAALDRMKKPKEYSMTSVLRGLPGEFISVVLIPDKVAAPPNAPQELADLMKQIEGSIQLRGEIDDRGRIESFFLQQRQKNILALFFELPKEPVKVGDRWSLAVNLLELGPGFVARAKSRVNQAVLVSIRKVEEETVATIDYLVYESVDGEFKDGIAKPKASAMDMMFVGRGEFSLEKGMWKSFMGRLKLKGAGVTASFSDQDLALEPLSTIPDFYLNLK